MTSYSDVKHDVKHRQYHRFVGDFETTVYDGQERTDVWASALVEFGSEDVKIFHSIAETYDYIMENLPNKSIIYYHNLKFDGAFWIDYLLQGLNFKLCGVGDDYTFTYSKIADIKNNTLITTISAMGEWYRLVFKANGKTIELRDSLKLLPFSVKTIGKSFGTQHKKLDMEYKGFRFPGCEITPEEQHYIANDVLVVKEALEIMETQGHMKLTIGSCCLSEFKQDYDFGDYDYYFPNLYEIPLDSTLYGSENVGEYIKNAYRGGWCYLVPAKKGVHHNGFTADVNSLYPSVMHSESGCKYPYGKPIMWKGNYIPTMEEDRFFYVRFRCRFRIRDGYLPFIQVKNDLRYKPREMLTTSDIWIERTQRYYSQYRDFKGNILTAYVTLTVTQTDWALINEHYILEDLEILDGAIFYSQKGLFDRYINKYKKIKQESTGAIRTLAKLFLNNLYGKMAASKNSSYKVPLVIDGIVKYGVVEAFEKTPGYIAIGAAITSYARDFTIRAAQANYYGPDKPGFIYADTDSIHCDIPLENVKGVRVHPTDFCAWKIETNWDVGMFTRAKTYIEHVTVADGAPVEPFYNIKCAGMPDRCKRLMDASLRGVIPEGLPPDALDFVKIKRELKDFDVGLRIPGKLMPRRIPGGVLLVETDFEMR